MALEPVETVAKMPSYLHCVQNLLMNLRGKGTFLFEPRFFDK